MQRAELALQLEPLIAKRAKENQIAAQNNTTGRAVLQNSVEQVAPINTKHEVAKIAGVSHDTHCFPASASALRGRRRIARGSVLGRGIACSRPPAHSCRDQRAQNGHWRRVAIG
jgi:hypothetical protein